MFDPIVLVFALLAFGVALICACGWSETARKYGAAMEQCEELLEERDDARRACEVYRMSHRAARTVKGELS